MNNRIVPSIFGTALLVTLLASAALAQVQRTFVSGLGSDSNPCSRTAPCRTFGQAISQTNSSGEVYVLDSAGYSTFTVTKPISIVAPPGLTAGISVFSGDGIVILAGASDTVILRGLTINNQGSSGNGMVFTAGGMLHIESCVVNGFTPADGVELGAAGSALEVKDSIFRGNGIGIEVHPASGSAKATIDRVRFQGNGVGLDAHGGSRVTVRDSVASANGDGFVAEVGTGGAAMNIENCVASNNSGAGIRSSSGPFGIAAVRVSNSTVTDNSIGLDNEGTAVLLSRGNNTVEVNTTNTQGTIGSYGAK